MAIDVTAGSATAVAYDTAANADAYFAARGITAWTGTDAEKEAALVRGCDFLERKYRGQWIGVKATDTQALSWPRGWAEDVDGYPIETDEIPEGVKQANYEAALLVIGGTDLEPALERGGAAIRERVKAGPVESETEYSAGAPHETVYRTIEGPLAGLLRRGSGTKPLARA